MTHTITTKWNGGLQFESSNPNNISMVMEPLNEDGTPNKGVGPKAMMLSALAACTGLDVISILNKMKVSISDFKIVVEGNLTEAHPKYYQSVKVNYHFYGSELKVEKIKKAVSLSANKYCGVMEMFRQFAKLTTDVHFHSEPL